MTNPIIEYFPNGIKKFELYYLNGVIHRDPLEGPAVIWYYPNGEIELEQYRSNGILHRDPSKGPARILYHENGQKEYIVDGKCHNQYGPAYIDYRYHIYDWHLNDKEYTNEVNEYLDKHNLSWQDMTQTDFDIMWTILL